MSKMEMSACRLRKLHARISTAVRLSTPYALTGFVGSMSSAATIICLASFAARAAATSSAPALTLLIWLSCVCQPMPESSNPDSTAPASTCRMCAIFASSR